MKESIALLRQSETRVIEKTQVFKQANDNKISGSEALVKSLIAEGVEIVFGYPGGAIMPVYDTLYKYKREIQHILVRHEQGAVHAAQGYARATGKVGVCIATSGPGATNFITGIADAFMDSTSIVCITGQVASHLLGTSAFQETDIFSLTIPVTKWNVQVTKGGEIPEAIAKAFYITKTGRPGPVLIDITKDAQFEQINFQYKPCKEVRGYIPKPKIDLKKVEEAAAIINNSKKPLLVFGQGVILAEAEKELKFFIEKSGIPAASTILGLSALSSNHPLFVGMLGMHGNYGPNKLTNECDVLVAVGMRFDDRVTGDAKRYAKQAKIIHIEIDAAEIDKIIKADVAIHADAKEALNLLCEGVKQNDYSEWIKKFKLYTEIEYDRVIRNEIYSDKKSLTMAEVIRIISEKSNGEAIIVSDVGQHQMVTARYYQFKVKETRSCITSGGLGTMGFCLPAAIGAKIGKPDREVIGIIGDGGFQMTIQELGTILQSGVPVKLIILNNNYLGMVRQWQELFFDGRYSQTKMINPDFKKIAEAYSLNAEKVTERKDLKSAIERLLTTNEPYILEVVVEKEENVFPMIPTGASVSEIRLD